MRPIFISTVLLMLTSVAFAGVNDDANAAFCKYVYEQALAQRDLLRTPQAVVGPTQPSLGTAAQIVVGLQNSLADDRKAGLTVKEARKTCALYIATTDAQQHLLYAMPSIEKDVLRHRLHLIEEASNFLDALIQVNMKSVEAHNLARPAVYSMESAKVRLDTSRTTTLTGITSPYVPDLSPMPLRTLIAAKLQAEDETQKAAVKLAKQNAWDFRIEAGAHRQITPTNSTGVSPFGAYGGFTLTYNLGSHAIDRHLDNSVAAYDKWKATQFDDVSQQSQILQHQITDTISIQREQLTVLESHDVEITKELSLLEGAETNAALTYRNGLLADQAVLRVDLEDVKFRIARLQQYLAENF